MLVLVFEHIQERSQILCSTQMTSVQAYALRDLSMPRQNQMHGQKCACICIWKPLKDKHLK